MENKVKFEVLATIEEGEVVVEICKRTSIEGRELIFLDLKRKKPNGEIGRNFVVVPSDNRRYNRLVENVTKVMGRALSAGIGYFGMNNFLRVANFNKDNLNLSGSKKE